MVSSKVRQLEEETYVGRIELATERLQLDHQSILELKEMSECLLVVLRCCLY